MQHSVPQKDRNASLRLFGRRDPSPDEAPAATLSTPMSDVLGAFWKRKRPVLCWRDACEGISKGRPDGRATDVGERSKEPSKQDVPVGGVATPPAAPSAKGSCEAPGASSDAYRHRRSKLHRPPRPLAKGWPRSSAELPRQLRRRAASVHRRRPAASPAAAASSPARR